MSPAEWTALLVAASGLLTGALATLGNFLLQRAQARKLAADTQQILKEVRPNGGSSSHDKLQESIAGVMALQEAQGALLTVHIAESAADRKAIHNMIDHRPWDRGDLPHD